jgi:hypothetical protein
LQCSQWLARGLTLPQSPNNRFERSRGRLRCAREGVDDWDKAASLGVNATPRRSTSSLGFMFTRITIVLAGAALLGVVLICIYPPFPPVMSLLDDSFDSLVRRYGPPSDVMPDLSLPQQLRPAKSVAWQKSRIIAVWELRINYTVTPFSATASPDYISQCLNWGWLGFHLPCNAAFRARVRAP